MSQIISVSFMKEKEVFIDKLNSLFKKIPRISEDQDIHGEMEAMMENIQKLLKAREYINEEQIKNVMLKINDLCNEYLYLRSKILESQGIDEIFVILTTIRSLFKVLTVQQSLPAENPKKYLKEIADFKKQLMNIKGSLDDRTIFLNNEWIEIAQQFHNDTVSRYIPSFSRAAISEEKLSPMLNQIQAYTENLCVYIGKWKESISYCEEITMFLSELNEKLPSLVNSGSYDNKLANDFAITNQTGLVIPLSTMREEVFSCTQRLSSLAAKLRSDISQQIFQEIQQITIATNASIILDNDSGDSELKRKLDAYEEIIKLMNMTEGSINGVNKEALTRLSKEQLITAMVSILSKKNVTIPLELRVSSGSSNDYKELTNKYEELRRKVEETNAINLQQELTLTQLKTENKRLKIELKNSNSANAIREKIRITENQLEEISKALKQKLKNGDILTRGGTHSSSEEFKEEVARLVAQKEDLNKQLSQIYGNEAQEQIKFLNQELESLQKELIQKSSIIQTLEKQIEKGNSI